MQLEYGFDGLIGDLNFSIFYFTLGATLFEVHYPIVRYMDAVHRFCVKVIGFIVGTTVFMVIFFPFFLHSGLDRPLRDLLAGVQRVNAGDFNVKVPIHGADEIGYVARSFNTMVASVNEADQKLKAYTQDLARRVRERTRNLSKKNEALARALNELQAAQKQLILQKKMASLGQLVAGVAHEINNPIGAVQSSADVAARCVEKIVHEVETADALETLKSSRTLGQTADMLKKIQPSFKRRATACRVW